MSMHTSGWPRQQGACDAPAPRFTIGMPAYNAAQTIGDAIESVLAQTRTDWELVVVDDGSQDATVQVASRYAERDPRIKVVQTAHAGCGAARNAAYAGSGSPYLCRIDADDVYAPDYLESMNAFMGEHPGYQVYSCNAEKLYGDGRVEPLLVGDRWSAVSSVTLDELIDHNPIFQMTVIERDAYLRVGGTRTTAHLGGSTVAVVEDYDFWLRALNAGARHIYTPRVLGRYRIHAAQVSADLEGSLISRIATLEAFATTAGLSGERVRHCGRVVATLKKRIVELRVGRGDVRGILPLFREARAAYGNPVKYHAALWAGRIDERLLARVIGGRKIGHRTALR